MVVYQGWKSGDREDILLRQRNTQYTPIFFREEIIRYLYGEQYEPNSVHRVAGINKHR